MLAHSPHVLLKIVATLRCNRNHLRVLRCAWIKVYISKCSWLALALVAITLLSTSFKIDSPYVFMLSLSSSYLFWMQIWIINIFTNNTFLLTTIQHWHADDHFISIHILIVLMKSVLAGKLNHEQIIDAREFESWWMGRLPLFQYSLLQLC